MTETGHVRDVVGVIGSPSKYTRIPAGVSVFHDTTDFRIPLDTPLWDRQRILHNNRTTRCSRAIRMMYGGDVRITIIEAGTVVFSLTPYYSGVHIISATHAMIDMKIVAIYDLPVDVRQRLFFHLFQGMVSEISYFEPFQSTITFLIQSVINTSSNKFDYVAYRSVFTPQERLAQTVAQLHSIQKLGVDAIILEGSRLSLDQIEDLVNAGSRVVLCCTDTRAFAYANTALNKSIYECYVLGLFTGLMWDSRWIFKFGGRYALCDNFDITSYLKDAVVMKRIGGALTYTKRPLVQGILYSIPGRLSAEFVKLYARLETLFMDGEGSVEEEMYREVTELVERGEGAVEWIERMGVCGRDGVRGEWQSL